MVPKQTEQNIEEEGEEVEENYNRITYSLAPIQYINTNMQCLLYWWLHYVSSTLHLCVFSQQNETKGTRNSKRNTHAHWHQIGYYCMYITFTHS